MVQQKSEIEFIVGMDRNEELTPSVKENETTDSFRSEVDWISDMLSDYEERHFPLV